MQLSKREGESSFRILARGHVQVGAHVLTKVKIIKVSYMMSVLYQEAL